MLVPKICGFNLDEPDVHSEPDVRSEAAVSELPSDEEEAVQHSSKSSGSKVCESKGFKSASSFLVYLMH